MVRPVLLVLLLAASQPVLAWSALGHRLVGALAERHLTPTAERQVQALLQGEPDPTLAGVATWADALRDDDPERFKATARWHYVNSPGCEYVPARDCPDGNCATGAIEAQRAILADRNQPLAARRDALKFLVHFVGDIHQPMHASSRNDKGGNDYQISLRTDLEPEAYARNRYANGVMAANMHSIWDYYILGTPRLDLAQYTRRLDALPWPPVTGPISTPQAWAGESCRLIETRHLYPEGHKIDQAYLEQNRPLAEQRVRQAAWRLAEVLNETLR